MTDTATAAEPITLEAFDPAGLLMDANARTNAEATVDKAFVAVLKAHAATSPEFPVHGDGLPVRNYVPVTLVRRPDGQLRVRAGHRRTIGCMRAGVPVLGFVAGDEGDEQADRRARLIEQWNENHHRERDDRPRRHRRPAGPVRRGAHDRGRHRQGHRPAPAAGRRVPGRGPVRGRGEGRRAVGVPDDLLQAATLAEFEGDDEALTALLKRPNASPDQFDHIAARLRATRGRAAKPGPPSPPGSRRRAYRSTATGPTCRGPWPWTTCATATGTRSPPRRTPPAPAGP